MLSDERQEPSTSSLPRAHFPLSGIPAPPNTATSNNTSDHPFLLHHTPLPLANDIRLRRTIKPSPDWTLSQHAAPSRRASFPQLDSLPAEQPKKRRQSAGPGELLWNSVMKTRAKAKESDAKEVSGAINRDSQQCDQES